MTGLKDEPLTLLLDLLFRADNSQKVHLWQGPGLPWNRACPTTHHVLAGIHLICCLANSQIGRQLGNKRKDLLARQMVITETNLQVITPPTPLNVGSILLVFHYTVSDMQTKA